MRRTIFAFLALTAAACQDRAALRQQSDAADVVVKDSAAYAGFEQQARAVDMTQPAFPGALLPSLDSSVLTRMVIRTGHASIEVDSLEIAVGLVRELAARVGGYVAGVSIEAGTERLRSGTIEMKVPAERFDDAMSGLRPIGKLESVAVGAEDVGEELVDVTARMENARRLEQRLVGILATRAGKLKDVLDVEQALARVREEIERYEGRLRYLRAHAAVSTLAIYVHEPVPIVGPVGTSVMGAAFEQAWRNCVTLAAVLVQSLGFVIPLGVLALAGWGVVRRWRRKVPAPETARA